MNAVVVIEEQGQVAVLCPPCMQEHEVTVLQETTSPCDECGIQYQYSPPIESIAYLNV